MTAVRAEDIPGGLNHHGRPIFLASDASNYVPTAERPLSDSELLLWKQFQLYRTSLAMERRDSVYQSLTQNDATSWRLTQYMLGMPYPVIDNCPGMVVSWLAVRWYEHALTIALTVAGSLYLNSKPSIRTASIRGISKFWLNAFNLLNLECLWTIRSQCRLTGLLSNDPECRLYGVKESPEQLKAKAELWAKYAAYKEEWMRRYDYHIFGIRPGERYSFFSACWAPPTPVRYNTKTDYPKRINPTYLTTTPLSAMFYGSPAHSKISDSDATPLRIARPEIGYMYDGPDRTPAERTK